MIEVKKGDESWEEKTWNVPPMLVGKVRSPFAHSAVQLAVLLVRPLVCCDIDWEQCHISHLITPTSIRFSNRHFLLYFIPYSQSNLVFENYLD